MSHMFRIVLIKQQVIAQEINLLTECLEGKLYIFWKKTNFTSHFQLFFETSIIEKIVKYYVYK